MQQSDVSCSLASGPSTSLPPLQLTPRHERSTPPARRSELWYPHTSTPVVPVRQAFPLSQQHGSTAKSLAQVHVVPK
eukprot:351581-Chlamydomonas_euryale.AAC.3